MSASLAAHLAVFLARLRDRGVRVERTSAGRVRCTGPVGALGDADKAYLRANRDALAVQLRGTASDLGLRDQHPAPNGTPPEPQREWPVPDRQESGRCGLCSRAATIRLPPGWGGWGGWGLCRSHHAPIEEALSRGWRYGDGAGVRPPYPVRDRLQGEAA